MHQADRFVQQQAHAADVGLGGDRVAELNKWQDIIQSVVETLNSRTKWKK